MAPHHQFFWMIYESNFFKVGTDLISWRGTTHNKLVLIIVVPKVPNAMVGTKALQQK
jgi:hypothetical protein